MLDLTGLGVGGIIGAGFFLGSAIVIRQAGPSVVLTYLAAGLILAQVMGGITTLAVHEPVRISYLEYIDRFLGGYASFLLGWAVVISGVLAIGSEAVAMAVYVRYWVPALSVGVLAVAFVALVAALNAAGVAGLGKVETGLAIAKTGVLLAFVGTAGAVAAGFWGGGPRLHPAPAGVAAALAAFFPAGPWAWLKAMLIVIFSYAGVTTVAMAESRTVDPVRTVPRAAFLTTVVVVLSYSASVAALLLLAPWRQLSPQQSPFVTALLRWHWTAFARVFNAVILAASFSVMAGTFYGTEWMLVSLAGWRQAPAFLRQPARGHPLIALAATTLATLAALVPAFVLPRSVYTDLTAASSYFSFVNWLCILLAFWAWYRTRRPPADVCSSLVWAPPYGTLLAAAAVAALGLYSVSVPSFRPGFLVFVACTAVISGGWWLRWRRATR